MNKTELVDAFMAKNHDVQTRAAAERAVNDVLESMSEGITDGGLALVGFGTFSIVHKEAREGRNPQSGEAIQIAARNAVKFKPSKAMQEAVN